MKIVEVNDNDIYGKVFNGYDIAQHFNGTDFDVKQLVISKFSSSDFVYSLFSNQKGLDLEHLSNIYSNEILSIHSLISFTSSFLNNNIFYKSADLVHLHQIHNSHFSLINLRKMLLTKPAVISFHDPWFLTGRCVHPGLCDKWKNGCLKCDFLDTLFPFSIDNCSELWKIKQQFLKDIDADIIVPSEYMYNLVKQTPIFNNLHVHLLPFGIDTDKFKFKISKKDAKASLGIDSDDIVIFFREAKEKGIDYIVSALKNINTDKCITLLTCSQKGLLNELKDKYNIIELGNLDEAAILNCYNASDIFLMPSLGESFGMMAVEAMASGLPVVVFDNTALPSVTNAPDVGVLVKNLDSDDLSKKISFLINNSDERNKRGSLGKNLVNERYKLDTYEKNLKKIYNTAYSRQFYKLSKDISDNCININYDNKDVQNCLYLLKKFYIKLFPNDKLNLLFNKLDMSLVDSNIKIKYSATDVQNLIYVFNDVLYKKVIYYEKKYSILLTIKSSLIYKFLRKIKNKIVYYASQVNSSKKEFYKFENRINLISAEVANYKSENDIIISSLKDENNSLKEFNNNQVTYISKLENTLYTSYRNLEIKFWQINNFQNKLLYESSLESLHKLSDFNPKVSIIIPAFNASNYLADAIDSALAQSYNNIEVIVVNDGSNDDNATEKIALSYGNRIRYFKKTNGGVSSALNYGIKKMSGEYFAWLSHDDLIDYNHIEKLVEFLSFKEHSNMIPFTSFKIIDEHGNIDINQTISAQLNCNDYKMSMVSNYYSLLQGEINGGSVIIKKSIFDECGFFDENLRITQERDLWSRLIKKYHFVNIPYDTASLRVHSNRVTSTYKNVIKKTDDKNLQIINDLSLDDILKLESNVDYFYKKIELFYKINDKNYMINDIEKIRKDKDKQNEKES